jgi:tetratricopeptide (TPR) repeat protein
LRKALGYDAIQTVSKHGYRFTVAVQGEPGVAPQTYSRFVRAKELTVQRALETVSVARDLFYICLAENVAFAPAWAWLGRCCWFRAKFSRGASADVELAIACFKRAFALDPDLACAHQFYTPVEADLGEAQNAMVRLHRRLLVHPDEPASLAGLVQVYRFCGLLEESIGAHQRVTELDPTIITSIPHTLFLAGNYAATIETYSGRASYYLDAAAWAALGDKQRATTLLRERLERISLSELIAGLMRSLLAALEGNLGEAVQCMKIMEIAHEPEVLVYLARHYSYIGALDFAMAAIKGAAEKGFVCATRTLLTDPWFAAIREHPDFELVLRRAERYVSESRSALGAGPGRFSTEFNTFAR